MENLVSKLQFQARAHPTNAVLRRALSEFRFLLNGVRIDTPDIKDKFDALRRDLDILATEGLWEPSKEDEESLVRLQQHLNLTSRDHTHEGHNHIDSIDHIDIPRRPRSTEPRSPVERVKSSERARSIGPVRTHEYPKPPLPQPQSPLPNDKAKPSVSSKDMPIIQPPSMQSPFLPVSTTTPTVLPLELVQALNHTFFLHLLATDPERVLPPGKSPLSIMTSPRAHARKQEGEQAKVEGRIREHMHKAFWDEALEKLSNPSPAVQLPRIRHLYYDLLEALKPLLPRSHPVLVTLSAPLSPTSAPLRSALMHLREILAALRERCAPARDAYIDQLIVRLDEPNQLASLAQLAELVVQTTRDILELAGSMKDDLSQFVLGEMDEKDLKVVITQQAMLREKSLILQLWPPSRIEPAWKAWLDELQPALYPGAESVQPPHRRWIYRLVQALGAGNPVSCPLPTIRIPGLTPEAEPDGVQKPPNALPPPFLVTCPSLLVAQNYLQALVIAASLRSLVRLPPRFASASAAAAEDGPSFMERVWTLLKASIEEEPGAGQTKIINLEDEVVRARRACSDAAHPCTPDEEARLRAAVDRTLQPRDPVFLLLQKRLLQALAAWLVSSPSPSLASASAPGTPLDAGSAPVSRASTPTPVHMQTGRDRPGKRPRLHLGLDSPQSAFAGWERERERGRAPPVKGFEDEVLVREVGETFRRIGVMVDWVERIWQDLVETGEVGGVGGLGSGAGSRQGSREPSRGPPGGVRSRAGTPAPPA
ncbi:hypothetical protein C8Q70DRAFT_1130498 [Cubamyces menziesii]|nr:hypothetical protein C8Q70DRAFT_1130498 [Cubamyces menziesii]